MLMKIAGNQIPLAWQQIQFAFNSVPCNNCLRYRMQDLQAVDVWKGSNSVWWFLLLGAFFEVISNKKQTTH